MSNTRECYKCFKTPVTFALFWFSRDLPELDTERAEIRRLCARCRQDGWWFAPDGKPTQDAPVTQQTKVMQ